MFNSSVSMFERQFSKHLVIKLKYWTKQNNILIMTFTDKIRHHQLLKLITGEHELINGVNLNIFSLPTAAWSVPLSFKPWHSTYSSSLSYACEGLHGQVSNNMLDATSG